MITKEAIEAAKKAAPPFWRDTANFEKHVSKILTAALAAMPSEREIDEGRFEQWTLTDFAGQCRMQARDNLDPEYSQFMAALSARLSALAAMPAQGVKDLEWVPSWGPDEDGDECHVAGTSFGTFAVERMNGRWKWRYCFDEYYDEDEFECEGLEAGKIAAQALWASRISPFIEAGQPASLASENERLRKALVKSIVTAACELDGPAAPTDDDTICIGMGDLEAIVERHVTAALERT